MPALQLVGITFLYFFSLAWLFVKWQSEKLGNITDRLEPPYKVKVEDKHAWAAAHGWPSKPPAHRAA